MGEVTLVAEIEPLVVDSLVEVEPLVVDSLVEMDPMLAIYLEEFSELIEAFDQTIQTLLENSQDKHAFADAQRQLHTIKGGARMTGLEAVGDLSSAGEDLLDLVVKGKIEANGSLLETLRTLSDKLYHMYELASKGSKVDPDSQLIEKLANLSLIETEVTTETNDDISETESRAETEELINVADLPEIDLSLANDPFSSSLFADDDPMVAIYLEELEELVHAFDATTQSLIKKPDSTDAISDAERQLHTIKGGARMTGLLEIGDLSHAGESLLNLVANGKVLADKSLLDKLQVVSDELFKMNELAVKGGEIEPATQLIEELLELSSESERPVDARADGSDQKVDALDCLLVSDPKVNNLMVDISSDADVELNYLTSEAIELNNGIKEDQYFIEEQPATVTLMPDFKLASESASELEQALANAADELSQNNKQLLSAVIPPLVCQSKEDIAKTSSIRVPIGLINQLITSTNEWGHKNIRLTEQYEENGTVVNELKRTANRLKQQIKNLELEVDSLIHAGGSIAALPPLKDGFDPLEMDEYTDLQQNSRSLAESMDDLMNLTEALDKGLKGSEKTSSGQEIACKSVQEGLISTRMTKVTGLLTRLKRIVRQVSLELGKEVSLEIADENSEMDRTILEGITASLEHLIRNSLTHGIEQPEERIKAGKPQQGRITLKIDREGPEIVIILEDDGAGIDVTKLKAVSMEKGLIDVNSNLTDKEVFQLILMSGMSTVDKVTQVSGRGVGMDVVNSEVNVLGGNILIDSEFGKYTRFTLSVPYNLATNQVMFLDIGGELLAVPVAKLKGMLRLPAEVINRSHGQQNPMINNGGTTYFLRYLGKTLGLDPRCGKRDIKTDLPVILLEENNKRVAYIVDEIRGNREIMLKPLGSLFEESRLLSSASILGGGEIVLLLNTHELISLGVDGACISKRQAEQKGREKKKVIMVVDDSITVRKITENLLLSIDYDVVTANDGIHALEVLKDEKPDLFLLDIEMPRMDGFELLENIRSSQRDSQAPVIMISSRSGAKHRNHASQLGANGFIGKPWEAKQLAAEIKTCLKPVMEKELA